jgi:hypothetical protein
MIQDGVCTAKMDNLSGVNAALGFDQKQLKGSTVQSK